eukprot:751230-Hanusia_phi.AAC.2
MARENVQDAIDAGRASVELGDAQRMPFLQDESMDKVELPEVKSPLTWKGKVFHMNCCYFWDNPEETLKEIFRVMKPG